MSIALFFSTRYTRETAKLPRKLNYCSFLHCKEEVLVNMTLTLNQILALVGKLDDTPGDETARERFRRFLKENVHEVGQIRDYIEECLRSSGDQYNRALQDLVNYLGNFLGFDVTFGRY
jgi:hypothetical protein